MCILLQLAIVSYRLLAIASGKKQVTDFARNQHSGPPWYQRTTDAVANATEYLLLYSGIVVLVYFNQQLQLLNTAAYIIIGARIMQTTAHIISTSAVFVQLRFGFWLLQMGFFLYLLLKLFILLFANYN